MDEIERIIAEFRRRESEIPEQFYSLDRPANRYLYNRSTAVARKLLDTCRLPLPPHRRVLEVGCGHYARWLVQFNMWGTPAAQLCGIDLYEPHIAKARPLVPGADLRVGDAEFLPWPDASFDAVVQSTMFTSILSREMHRNVAREMDRVLKPGGVVLWYDFIYNNPRNPNVRAIRVADVQQLFPAYAMQYQRVTLVPPLARAVVPISQTLAATLERLPILRSHIIATLRKPPAS